MVAKCNAKEGKGDSALSNFFSNGEDTVRLRFVDRSAIDITLADNTEAVTGEHCLQLLCGVHLERVLVRGDDRLCRSVLL